MGGGVIVAIAAALWLAYLVPVWLRRREYLAYLLGQVGTGMPQGVRVACDAIRLDAEPLQVVGAQVRPGHQGGRLVEVDLFQGNALLALREIADRRVEPVGNVDGGELSELGAIGVAARVVSEGADSAAAGCVSAKG